MPVISTSNPVRHSRVSLFQIMYLDVEILYVQFLDVKSIMIER